MITISQKYGLFTNLFVLIIIFTLTTSSFIGINSIIDRNIDQKDSEITETKITLKTTDLTNHTPILIQNNLDMSNLAEQGDWIGNGSKSNPYKIENFLISNDSEDLITIKNTNLFFRICNNKLDSSNHNNYGINLYNVTNCEIENNSIQRADYGIYLSKTDNTTLSNNSITNNNRKGLYVINSKNITIYNNLLLNNNKDFSFRYSYSSDWWNGIRLISSHNNLIIDNTIENCGYNGIRLDSSSDNLILANTINNHDAGIGLLQGSGKNEIVDNNCFNNDAGFYTEKSGSNNNFNNSVYANEFHGGHVGAYITSFGDEIFSNRIYNNRHYGIQLGSKSIYLDAECQEINVQTNFIFNNTIGLFLENSRVSEVHSNHVFTNEEHGIYIESISKQNDIFWNNFTSNNLLEDSQAFDDGTGNIFRSNFWSDWTGPDNDNNGIVDNPYLIPGEVNNQDFEPIALMEIISTTTTGIISTLSTTQPHSSIESSPGWLIIGIHSFLLLIIKRKRRKNDL